MHLYLYFVSLNEENLKYYKESKAKTDTHTYTQSHINTNDYKKFNAIRNQKIVKIFKLKQTKKCDDADEKLKKNTKK